MTLAYESVMEKLEGVITYNGYFAALCIFHDDHHPSLMVYPDRYYCKTCRATGTTEYLDKRLGNDYDPTAHRVIENKPPVLPQWRKWLDKYDSVEGIAKAAYGFYCRQPALRHFFMRRQIDRYYREGMFGWLDWWNLFPVFDPQHKIIDIVVRGDKGKGDTRYVLLKTQDAHRDPPIYVPDWQRVLAADTVYVVYGIIDAWALHDLGLPVISGTTGKSLSVTNLRPLNKQWVIVPDEQEEKEAWDLKIKLGSRARVQEINYPFRTKDPDGVRTRYGNETLTKLLGVKHEQFA